MSNFTWVEIYKEIVEKIKDKNTEDLVNLLKDCENCQINYSTFAHKTELFFSVNS